MSRTLADIIFWIAVFCCAGGQLLILRSVLRVRGGAGTDIDGIETPRARLRVRRGPEVVWAIVPALALAFVLAFTWRAIHALPDEAPPVTQQATSR